MNLVTPKPGAKHELFSTNWPLAYEVALLNKSSCLAPTLVVTKFTFGRGMILVTLSCTAYVMLWCSTYLPLRPEVSLLNI